MDTTNQAKHGTRTWKNPVCKKDKLDEEQDGNFHPI
jgi:hypothetical protein